jgi:hypothetical protein
LPISVIIMEHVLIKLMIIHVFAHRILLVNEMRITEKIVLNFIYRKILCREIKLVQ